MSQNCCYPLPDLHCNQRKIDKRFQCQLQAVGASVRIFDLMDRKPIVPIEDGEILPNLDGRELSCRFVPNTFPHTTNLQLTAYETSWRILEYLCISKCEY